MIHFIFSDITEGHLRHRHGIVQLPGRHGAVPPRHLSGRADQLVGDVYEEEMEEGEEREDQDALQGRIILNVKCFIIFPISNSFSKNPDNLKGVPKCSISCYN